MKMLDGIEAKYQPHVIVACMGEHFMPGVMYAIRSAADKATAEGCAVSVYGFNDLCVSPFHGLGAMRNMAFMRALEAKATHVLILDNDILLTDPRTIINLVRADKLIITPWFNQQPSETEAGVWHRVQLPTPAPNQGLALIHWIATNCLLFNMAIFKMLGPRLFTDPMIVNEEEYIFGYLRLYGIPLWQDTDTMVDMLRRPTRLWDVIPGGRPVNQSELILLDRETGTYGTIPTARDLSPTNSR